MADDKGKELVARLKRFAESPSDTRWWSSYLCPQCREWFREQMTLADMQKRMPCKRCRERN